MLGDTDVGKHGADVEKGEIGEEGAAAAEETAEGSGENLA
jgi:hypothetical protein